MVYVLLVIAGLIPLTMKGLALAGVWQLVSAAVLDWTLDRRDSRQHERTGWPKRSDFPVVGELGWEDKVHQMMDDRKRRR